MYFDIGEYGHEPTGLVTFSVDHAIAALDDAIFVYVYREADSLDCCLLDCPWRWSLRELCEASLNLEVPLPGSTAKDLEDCEISAPLWTYGDAARALLRADWS